MNFREDIKAYIDGELTEARAAEVRSAIDADPALREEYEFMKGLSSQIQSSVKSAPVKGYEKVKAAVAGKRRFKVRWIEGLAVAATVAILGAVMFPMFAQSKSAAKRSAVLSDQKQRQLRELNNAEVADEAEFPDDIDFYAGAPVPYYRDRSESGDDGVALDERFGSSMGVSGTNTFDGNTGNQGARRGGDRRYRSSALSIPLPGTAGINGNIKSSNVPVELLTPAEVDEVRLVIKDASLSLIVLDVREAMDETTLLVKAAKGYIESSSMDEGEKRSNGYMTLRMPEKEFEGMVSAIRAYGEVKSDQLGGDDVTGTVADVEARIKTLTAEEDSYRVLLRNAKKIGDILDIKDRISQVRQQIESYVARRRTMSRLAALSTITVRFSTEEKEEEEVAVVEEPDEWFLDTKVASIGVLKGVGKFIAQVGTFLFILVPIWVPTLLIGLWFRGRALRPVDAS